jgi:hypothetical protein
MHRMVQPGHGRFFRLRASQLVTKGPYAGHVPVNKFSVASPHVTGAVLQTFLGVGSRQSKAKGMAKRSRDRLYVTTEAQLDGHRHPEHPRFAPGLR